MQRESVALRCRSSETEAFLFLMYNVVLVGVSAALGTILSNDHFFDMFCHLSVN